MQINTLRVLVDWKCNLKCSYCCNEQERFRKNIIPTPFSSINWGKYEFICISGGEPLLFLDRVKMVCDKSQGYNIIYSNGLLWTAEIAKNLQTWGIKAANIGLHYPKSFDRIINNVTDCTKDTNINVRFHVWDQYKNEMLNRYPNISFRFWTMNDCDRDNEERIVLQ